MTLNSGLTTVWYRDPEEITKLRAEVERLRAALRDALTLAAATWDENHPILQRARAALEPKS